MLQELWQKIDGNKTYIGIIAGTLLALIVDWSPDDGVTWDTTWVRLLATVITGWTTVSVRSALKKIEKS